MGVVAAVLAACARWIISGGYAPRGCVCALQARARRAIHRLPAAAIGVPRARSPGSLGGWACGLPSTFLAAGVYPAGCVDVTERFASGSTCCARCRAKSGTPGPLSGLLDGSPSRRRRCKGGWRGAVGVMQGARGGTAGAGTTFPSCITDAAGRAAPHPTSRALLLEGCVPRKHALGPFTAPSSRPR